MSDRRHEVPRRIGIAGVERLPELRELWLSLHRHHRTTARAAIQPDDDLSWAICRAGYHELMSRGRGFVIVADDDAGPVGYAAVEIHDGPDDTYAGDDGRGEVLTLVVAESERGSGLGSALLDAVDAELAVRGISDQIIAVMDGNGAAQRLYERRGFTVAELILFRQGPRPE
jgi:ribosomal protein S18 acetylase RimI-like enzyme